MQRFKSLSLRVKLFQAKRELRALHRVHLEAYRLHQKELQEGTQTKETEERSTKTAEVSVEKAREVEGLQALINQIRSARLVRKLIKHGLDLPNQESYRTVHVTTGNQTTAVSSLTKFGESKVRRALKIERREAWDFRFKVITPLLSGMTGLVGALIGLLGSPQILGAIKQLKVLLFG